MPGVLVIQDRLAGAYFLAATAVGHLRAQAEADAHTIVAEMVLRLGAQEARARSKRSESLAIMGLDVLASGGQVALRPAPPGHEFDALPEPPKPPPGV